MILWFSVSNSIYLSYNLNLQYNILSHISRFLRHGAYKKTNQLIFKVVYISCMVLKDKKYICCLKSSKFISMNWYCMIRTKASTSAMLTILVCLTSKCLTPTSPSKIPFQSFTASCKNRNCHLHNYNLQQEFSWIYLKMQYIFVFNQAFNNSFHMTMHKKYFLKAKCLLHTMLI